VSKATRVTARALYNQCTITINFWLFTLLKKSSATNDVSVV